MAVSGILLVDKPPEWTSMDVCAKLRGIAHERRVGHSGTLDPMATGLLAVFFGRATRAIQFAEGDGKEYLASLRLGLVTDTQDIWGAEVSRSAARPAEGEIAAVLSRFRGDIMQTPPMYSAIKRDGRKLYELARRGIEVEREPRPVRIEALELLGREGDELSLRVRCSKGTYIRALCHDIGAALGCGGCMSALRRTACGAFSVAGAHTMAELLALDSPAALGALLLPVDSLFSRLPALVCDGEGEKKCRCGAAFPLDAPEGLCRLYGESGCFLALCRAEGGVITTVKSFFEV